MSNVSVLNCPSPPAKSAKVSNLNQISHFHYTNLYKKNFLDATASQEETYVSQLHF